MNPSQRQPGELTPVQSSLELDIRSGAKSTRLSAPSVGFSSEVAPLAAGVIENNLGPVVRRTRGDIAQVFEGQKLNSIAGVMLAALAFTVCSAIAEFSEMPRGLLRLALVTAPGWSVLAWLAARSWRRRRLFSRTGLAERLAMPGLAETIAPIRLAGVVESCGELFDAPGTDQKVVYARTLFVESDFGRPSLMAREEIRAVPFRIRLDDGTAVNLPPAQLHLADVPARMRNVAPELLQSLGAASHASLFRRRPPLLQATLAPGDRIEAVGHLSAQAHVDGVSGPSRLTPLAHAMVPPASGAIWVRNQKA